MKSLKTPHPSLPPPPPPPPPPPSFHFLTTSRARGRRGF